MQVAPQIFEFNNSAESEKLNAAICALLPYGRCNSEEIELAIRGRGSLYAQATATLEWCEKFGANITYPGAGDYPSEFSELAQKPRVLFYLGYPVWKTNRGLSVVGSRDPSRQTMQWMEEHLLGFAKHTDLFIASGGARGVDQCAHRVSLLASRPTLAFLPSGLNNIFPADFGSWLDAILSGGGAVLSEYAPSQCMHRGNFQRRNRMIAAVSSHLFIAQAGRKSGTMITARQALDLHRQIAVLPSSPMDPRTLGGLDLLHDGAQLVRDQRDLETFFQM